MRPGSRAYYAISLNNFWTAAAPRRYFCIRWPLSSVVKFAHRMENEKKGLVRPIDPAGL